MDHVHASFFDFTQHVPQHELGVCILSGLSIARTLASTSLCFLQYRFLTREQLSVLFELIRMVDIHYENFETAKMEWTSVQRMQNNTKGGLRGFSLVIRKKLLVRRKC